MKRLPIICGVLLCSMIVGGIGYIRYHIATKKRLWAEKVETIRTVHSALEVLGKPSGEWSTIPSYLSRYSTGSISNFNRVLMFTRVNQGAFLYVDENNAVIAVEVFEQ